MKLTNRLLISWAVADGPCPGPLAQLAEQWTFNPLVVGSSPARPTITKVWATPLRNHQPCHAWLACLSFYFSPILSFNKVPTASREPFFVMVSLAMSGRIVAGAAGEPSPRMASSLLPEYVAEVVL